MALKELTLFGTKNKINIAIKRIQEFEPPVGYYLAFSGGKDSQTIYELTKMSGVKFDTHFNLTTVDPPELIYFIRNNYPDVQFHRPERSMWDLILWKMSLPTRISKFCCEHLKEGGGKDRIVMTGIRWAESSRRKQRKMVENCYRKNMNKLFVHPIIDWTDNDVWDFIKLRNLKYCSLYDNGYKRIGCIMCPAAGIKGILRDKENYPKYYDKYLKVCQKLLEHRKKRKLKTDWDTPEKMMHWWIYGKQKGNPDQTVIFE